MKSLPLVEMTYILQSAQTYKICHFDTQHSGVRNLMHNSDSKEISPLGRDDILIEPYARITDAFNKTPEQVQNEILQILIFPYLYAEQSIYEHPARQKSIFFQ